MSRTPLNILDRPVGGKSSRSESQVSLSAFAYLYLELVQYHQHRVASISELERKLEASGYGVGLKVLELLAYRSKETKREIRLMNILQFISSHVWKALFGKPADSLERSIDHTDEFMIVDFEPLTSLYVSVPSDLGQLSVDAYMSGIVAGILDGAGFDARVTAHTVALAEDGDGSGGGGGNDGILGSASSTPSMFVLNPHLPPRREKAVFLVKFRPDVLARDATLER